MERPAGITLLGWLSVASGALTLLAGCGLAALFALSGTTMEDASGFVASTTFGVCLFAVLGIGAVFGMLLGWGLLALRGWARILTIVCAIVGLLAFPVGTIANAIILWYMFQPEVKEAFGAV